MSFENLSKDTPPIIKQYINIKKHHADALVFFRVGDFYELFYKDAEIAAKELGIALTRKVAKNFNIPMSGVPYHAYETYLAKLVKAGYKVAICEQLETPLEAKNLKKNIVDRAVTRIVTPGTVTEDNILVDGSYNYLAAVYFNLNNVSIAWVDISTGDFYVETALKKELQNILYRVNPKEILIDARYTSKLNEELVNLITLIDKEKFNYISTQKILSDFYSINISSKLSYPEVIVSGVLLSYLSLTQKSIMPQLLFPQVWNKNNIMRLDFFTRRSLELDKKLNGEYKGSLRSIIDKTQTKEGKRLLQEWLMAPLVNYKDINDRLNVVDYFYNNTSLLTKITDILNNSPDITRLFTKIVLNRGGPRDLFLLREALDRLTLIRNTLLGRDIPALIKEALINAGDYSYLQSELKSALKEFDDLPNNIKGGNFIRSNYRNELELFKTEYQSTLRAILQLQQKYILQTKLPVNSLKVQNNNLMGYFLEVSSKHSNVLFNDTTFVHKQTLSNCVRFTTSDLIDKESTLIKTAAKIEAFEENIYNELLDLVCSNKENIVNSSKALALVDVLTSFANLALEHNFVRPIVNNSNCIKIVAGRHPVVEQGLKVHNEMQFVSNDCVMDSSSYIFLITGPNMAGKSTYLRQNAIILILAQIGCYVPAKEATIGTVDAVFSRVGASDNLYQGQSTFMVEMAETATIVNNATNKSFIILDEIGRGTATYDGLSIAFAVIFYLHDKLQSKVLFATHYHELTKLKNTLKYVKTFFMNVGNVNNELIFMHNVVSGETNKSYGIYAAKLAGMPKEILKNAEQYLCYLESNAQIDNSLPLFKHLDYSQTNIHTLQSSSNLKVEQPSCTLASEKNLEMLNYIKSLNIDNLSPKEALEILYTIKDNFDKTDA